MRRVLIVFSVLLSLSPVSVFAAGSGGPGDDSDSKHSTKEIVAGEVHNMEIRDGKVVPAETPKRTWGQYIGGAASTSWNALFNPTSTWNQWMPGYIAWGWVESAEEWKDKKFEPKLPAWQRYPEIFKAVIADETQEFSAFGNGRGMISPLEYAKDILDRGDHVNRTMTMKSLLGGKSCLEIQGVTPIVAAAVSGNPKMMKLLKSRGANLDVFVTIVNSCKSGKTEKEKIDLYTLLEREEAALKTVISSFWRWEESKASAEKLLGRIVQAKDEFKTLKGISLEKSPHVVNPPQEIKEQIIRDVMKEGFAPGDGRPKTGTHK